MMHYRPAAAGHRADDASAGDLALYHERFVAVEAAAAGVRKARRIADESLRRAREAPKPHVSANAVFAALWQEHLRDREALFAAMRRLEDAREDLRRLAATLAAADPRPGSAGRRRTGRPGRVSYDDPES